MPEPARRKINAKEIVADIRSGMTNLQLYGKYDLSPKLLESIIKKLVAANLLSLDEWDRRDRKHKPEQKETAWTCPSCSREYEQLYSECPNCGIVAAKIQSVNTGDAGEPCHTHDQRLDSLPPTTSFPLSHREPTPVDDDDEIPNPEPLSLDNHEWLLIGCAALFALVSMPFFWLSWTFETFKILVHELGHAIFGWLFGYPSLPAFDMLHGGGITLHMQRSWGLILLVYLGLGFLIYIYRSNLHAVIFWSAVGILHFLISLTSFHSVIIVFMGHGFELVIATLFLYRAISGRSIIHPWERPLYAVLGFFITFSDFAFAYKLLTSASFMEDYLGSKDGDLDPDFFVIANEHLHVSMRGVIIFFFVCTFLPPILSYLWYRYEQYIHVVMIKILRKNPTADVAQS